MKQYSRSLSILIILGLIYYSFYSIMPQKTTGSESGLSNFSTERALVHLKEITKKPHYVGSPEHEVVRDYILGELEKLGLETQVQEAFHLDQRHHSLVKPKNILARIKGSHSGKALMLLTHYDSAPIHSLGASDAGSGVVTILEGIRAFLSKGITPKNDIVILFTDAEELGLDGAGLFVKEHPWAKDIGLVLNFESRGSGGPSNMILETNGGNKTLVKEFIKANPDYPVATSLMYSIYKMLPNDTDSTVFREEGDISSYFFAFIDDHFDYHTNSDTYENLNRNTLEHQGSYLMASLNYFSEAPLDALNSDEDYVYFNMPIVKMVRYPFSWIFPMLILAFIIFGLLIFYGISTKRFGFKDIGKGFIPFLGALITSGLLGYFGWQLILKMYPQYLEIQHGFTYNGHYYITAFVLVSVAICFKFYRSFSDTKNTVALYIAPLFFWLLICTGLALYLKGGAYFIIPVLLGLLSLGLLIKYQTPSIFLLLLVGTPAIFIFVPLAQFFPIGLGSKMLVASSIFTVLIFGLLLPVVGSYKRKNLIFWAVFLLAGFYFIKAHFNSDYTQERRKPNSLVYIQNADNDQSYWVTYDRTLDYWTRNYLGEDPKRASEYISNSAGSKYNSHYTYAAKAPKKELATFKTRLEQDTLIDNLQHLRFTILPQMHVNRYLIYADTTIVFKHLAFNGKAVTPDKQGRVWAKRHPRRALLSYYVSDKDSLEIAYALPKGSKASFLIKALSFNLLEHPDFSVPKRAKDMMPKPFITTDAIIVRKTVQPHQIIQLKK